MKTVKIFWEHLIELLKKMDVPEKRITDVHWLNRNLNVRNSNHPNYQQARLLIKSLLDEERRKT